MMQKWRSGRSRVGASPVTSISTYDLVLEERRARAAHRVMALMIASLCLATICSSWLARPAFKCRSRQSEAKTNFKALYITQEAHRAEHGHYGTFEEIGWRPRGAKVRYEYVLTRKSSGHFTAIAVARASSDNAGDVWMIDETNTLTNVVNACR